MFRKVIVNRALGLVSASILGAAMLAPAAVHAGYPEKPITFVNPYAAGGPSDILGRIVAEKMSEILGQPIIMQNKPGAGASIGAAFVARAKADGYTALVGTAAAHVVSPMLEALSYDGVQDFKFVGTVGNIPNVLTVNPATGVSTVKQLIEESNIRPERFNYASAGNGSSPHITGENFKIKTGAKLLHVPYKGAAPAATDMVGGTVQVGFINLPAVLPFINSGKLDAIAIAASKRSPALPEVPTFAELGFQGFEGSSWYSLAVPAQTPDSVVATLYAALTKAMNDPDVKKKLETQGVEEFLMDGPEAREFISNDKKRIKTVLEAAGLIKD